MTELTVALPGRSYPILVGRGALEAGAAALRRLCPDGRATVVADETVWRLHGERLERALAGRGISFRLVLIPPGEASKSMEALARLYGELSRAGHGRGDPVIAFGGGVTGDLAGFAAATYMRGVPLVQIPTTLLAQVDASVGGKVAVNLPEGKNLAGCFWQPELVLADADLLCTLPLREWKAGIAEVVKYAAIGERHLAALMEAQDEPGDRLEEMISLCCACKADYVRRDERDAGARMMLNFGHTFGHALEKLGSYEKYSHGEAVAAGMALAARTGVLLGLTAPVAETRLLGMLDRAGISSACAERVADIVPVMTGDKKNAGGLITLILLRDFGEPFAHRISDAELLGLLAG